MRLRRFSLIAVIVLCMLWNPVYASGEDAAENASFTIVKRTEEESPGEYWEPDNKILKLGDTVYMPLRNFGESLGCSVEWNQEEQKIRLSKPGCEMEFTINSNTMLLNQESYDLKHDCVLIGSTTYVPLRSVCEGLGYFVIWSRVPDTNKEWIWISIENLLTRDYFKVQNDDNYIPVIDESYSRIDPFSYRLKEDGATSKGIQIGSSYADVINAYGPPTEETIDDALGIKKIWYMSVYVPFTEFSSLNFYFENDFVIEVMVYPH